MTKRNYKPSKMMELKNIMNVAEHAYITKCKGRGIKQPIPFRTMMTGYVICMIVISGTLIWIILR